MSPWLQRGFQVPTATLQKLSVALLGQGRWALPAWVPHPTAQETFPGPCLWSCLPPPAHPNGAAADEVPRPSTRLYSSLAMEELSHSMSLLSPNMSHHSQPSSVCETAGTCNTRSLYFVLHAGGARERSPFCRPAGASRQALGEGNLSCGLPNVPCGSSSPAKTKPTFSFFKFFLFPPLLEAKQEEGVPPGT